VPKGVPPPAFEMNRMPSLIGSVVFSTAFRWFKTPEPTDESLSEPVKLLRIEIAAFPNDSMSIPYVMVEGVKVVTASSR